MDPGFPVAYLFKEVSEKTRAFKLKRGICKHWGCSRPARVKGHDCPTCNSRKYRLRNPERYAFANVRASARKRRIPFNLTFEQFRSFCRETKYLEQRGRELESLTIDRIDPDLPYQVGNIRALTWRENCFHLVEKMTEPIEPIARAIAHYANGSESGWRAYQGEAEKVLEQVEILQRKKLEHEEAFAKALAEKGDDPDNIPF